MAHFMLIAHIPGLRLSDIPIFRALSDSSTSMDFPRYVSIGTALNNPNNLDQARRRPHRADQGERLGIHTSQFPSRRQGGPRQHQGMLSISYYRTMTDR
jgi:hypothetical protein